MTGGGASAQARVDAMASILGHYFLLDPQTEAMYSSAHGECISDPTEHVASSFAHGALPRGFQGHVRGKLKYVRIWKSDPEHRASRGEHEAREIQRKILGQVSQIWGQGEEK